MWKLSTVDPVGEPAVVRASFTMMEDTQAWCDEEGTVVSFIYLGLSQTRNAGVKTVGKDCGSSADEVFTGF